MILKDFESGVFAVTGATSHEAAIAAINGFKTKAEEPAPAWQTALFQALGITDGAQAGAAVAALTSRATAAEANVSALFSGLGVQTQEEAVAQIDKLNLDLSSAQSDVARLKAEQKAQGQAINEELGARGAKIIRQTPGTVAGAEAAPKTYEEFVTGYNAIIDGNDPDKTNKAAAYYGKHSALLNKQGQ